MNKLKIIKSIVFILTFSIFIGMLLAATLLYKKIKTPTSADRTQLNLQQPPETTINSVQSSNNLLYLHLSGGNISDRIIIIKTDPLAVTATINLN